jgi:hypothetical protein
VACSRVTFTFNFTRSSRKREAEKLHFFYDAVVRCAVFLKEYTGKVKVHIPSNTTNVLISLMLHVSARNNNNPPPP